MSEGAGRVGLSKQRAQWAAAAEQSGRSMAALLVEALRLRLGRGRLGFSEYLDFRLYQGDLPLERKREFGGWRAQRVLEDILIDDYSRFLSLDKVTMYALLQAHGLPIPALRAVYASARPGAILQLPDPDALMAWLREPGHLPVYLKPSMGAYGRGNHLLVALEGDRLLLGDGERVDLHEFVAGLGSPRGLGWLLQEPLAAAAPIAELCGAKISGVRVHSFLGRDGPVLTRAIWKIHAGRGDSDNFCHGASGNLLADVDIASGRIRRVVAGVGVEQRVDPVHPVSGRPLVGFALPHWDALKAAVLDAQLAFPGYLCPGWDIAICDDGPRILEVNSGGDIDLPQHAGRRGFIDDELMTLLAGRGLAALVDGPERAGERAPSNDRVGRRKHHWPW